jgi:hypothetical protein
LIVAAAYLFHHVFSGRGAFIHVGSLVGTIMAANVFLVITPNQKKMVAQLIAGETPDARLGAIGKQRSLHNNYLTLPVLLMMVSGHYPMLYSHSLSWLVVALILVAGGLGKHLINRHDAGDDFPAYSWAVPIAPCRWPTPSWRRSPRTISPIVMPGSPAIPVSLRHRDVSGSSLLRICANTRAWCRPRPYKPTPCRSATRPA